MTGKGERVVTMVWREVKYSTGSMRAIFYDATAAVSARQNEALPLRPGEAITRPVQALFRSSAANEMGFFFIGSPEEKIIKKLL